MGRWPLLFLAINFLLLHAVNTYNPGFDHQVPTSSSSNTTDILIEAMDFSDDDNNNKSETDYDYCFIDKNFTQEEKCVYVRNNTDKCEGGSYTPWTEFVICEERTGHKVGIIIASVIYLLLLFIMISSAADDCFSPNVAFIVAYLGISESVAGVTFMAFGNGAPDIFGSIASVLSSPTPKAGLALGELLGGNIFVTLIVTATIAFTKPFEATRFETVRDIIFFLLTLGWILFIFLFDNEVYLFQPLALLGLYAVYVGTVVFSHFWDKRKKRQIGEEPDCEDSSLERTESIMRNVTVIRVGSVIEVRRNSRRFSRRSNRDRGLLADCPTLLVEDGKSHTSAISTISETVERGCSEEDANVDGCINDAASQTSTPSPSDNLSDGPLTSPPQLPLYRLVLNELHEYFRPLSDTNWTEAGWFTKIMDCIKIPITLAFQLTIPSAENPWSKPVALIHAVTVPQLFLFAIEEYAVVPVQGGPVLGIYAFAVTLVVIVLLLIFTCMRTEPKYYKQLAAYIGFVMAIAWIYLLANEVVNVVTMFGVISGISHEVLGLTILAWSNSIGDVVADIAVVKQGFPNMALAAAIGGPLFNLLIGFGLPFAIARLKGTYVQIAFSTVNHILVLFLGISLIFTLCALCVQKFRMTRAYAACNCAIYLAFLVMIVLAETKVYTWGNGNEAA